MSSITDEGRKIALDKYGVRLLPSSTDRSFTIATSVTKGPFVEGTYITISLTDESYVATGGSSVTATTDDVALPLGVHDFVIPSGVTHIALISSESGALAAVWGS